MRTIVARRFIGLIAVIVGLLLALFANALVAVSLQPAPLSSGWLLMGVLIFLALFALRKRLAVLPVGSASGWLQLHIHAGLFSGGLFLIHTGGRIPTGPFEIVLASVYAAVFTSGVGGLAMSRLFARRLTARGANVLFERISAHRLLLQSEAERTVGQMNGARTRAVADQLYQEHLRDYFEQPRDYASHLLGFMHPCQARAKRIDAYRCYLADEDHEVLARLTRLVERKYELDFQYALQWTLKSWPFLHVPLTYCLLLLSLFHALLAHLFSESL